MKCGILFSGGKDSTYATFLTQKEGYDISCLITVKSENPDSYIFHTPSINRVEKQAEVMNKPIITVKTKGFKEKELDDLLTIVEKAKSKFGIEGLVTGAVESAYQASRFQNICDTLDLECFNPLWQKDQIELLEEIVENDFYSIITGVSAYPLDNSWLGRKIDQEFINQVKILNKKYKINPAGEGGEFESFVLDCPLFFKKLKIKDKKIVGKKNSWRMEIDLI